jgi:hypothetical protein
MHFYSGVPLRQDASVRDFRSGGYTRARMVRSCKAGNGDH